MDILKQFDHNNPTERKPVKGVRSIRMSKLALYGTVAFATVLLFIMYMMWQAAAAQAASKPPKQCSFLEFSRSAVGDSTASYSLPSTPWIFFVGKSPGFASVKWTAVSSQGHKTGRFTAAPGYVWQVISDKQAPGISRVLSAPRTMLRLELPATLQGLRVCYQNIGSVVVKP